MQIAPSTVCTSIIWRCQSARAMTHGTVATSRMLSRKNTLVGCPDPLITTEPSAARSDPSATTAASRKRRRLTAMPGARPSASDPGGGR